MNQVLHGVRKCHREGVLRVVSRLPEGMWVGLAEGTHVQGTEGKTLSPGLAQSLGPTADRRGPGDSEVQGVGQAQLPARAG